MTNDNDILGVWGQAPGMQPLVGLSLALCALAAGDDAACRHGDVSSGGHRVHDADIVGKLHKAEAEVSKSVGRIHRNVDAGVGAGCALEGPGAGIVEVYDEGQVGLRAPDRNVFERPWKGGVLGAGRRRKVAAHCTGNGLSAQEHAKTEPAFKGIIDLL